MINLLVKLATAPVTNSVKSCIIVVVDELYNPALKALRNASYTISMSTTASSSSVTKMTNRLVHILQAEGFRADHSSISSLVSDMNCDIRACLNVLQVRLKLIILIMFWEKLSGDNYKTNSFFRESFNNNFNIVSIAERIFYGKKSNLGNVKASSLQPLLSLISSSSSGDNEKLFQCNIKTVIDCVY